MYKLYASNNQIIVDEGSETVYVVPASSARLQVIEGRAVLYDLFNRSNKYGIMTFELGPIANVVGASLQSFADEDALYDYYVSISGSSTTTSSLTDGTQKTMLIDASSNVMLPSGTPRIVAVEMTRPNDTPGAYSVGDAINSSVASPTSLEFTNASIAVGGGGFMGLIKVESDITALASGTLRLWFFNEVPASIVGDHVAFVNNYANSGKRCFYVDVTFDSLLAGSDVVLAQTLPLFNEYVTSASTSIYCLIQTLSSFTPTASGKIKISLSLIKIA